MRHSRPKTKSLPPRFSWFLQTRHISVIRSNKTLCSLPVHLRAVELADSAAVAYVLDEVFHRCRIGPRLFHCFNVRFVVADKSTVARFVTLLGDHNLVDEADLPAGSVGETTVRRSPFAAAEALEQAQSLTEYSGAP